MSIVERRFNLKFLAKLGKTHLESFALLQQVYKEETMPRAHAFNPFACVKKMVECP